MYTRFSDDLLSRPSIQVNYENATEEELLVAAEAAPNRRSFVRLSAIRAFYLGLNRETICTLFNRSDRMVRCWINLFNQGGIDSLITKPHPGRPLKVKLQRLKDLLVPRAGRA